MFDLFRQKSTPALGIAESSSKDQMVKRVKTATNKVILYMRGLVPYTVSTHPLLKVINSINVDPRLDIMEYYNKVKAQAEDVARSAGINTPTHKVGVKYRNYFYGDGVTEILVYHAGKLDLLKIEDKWKDIVPVKVLRHDSTAYDLTPLNHTRVGGKGFAVINIDIPRLMIMYRQWWLAQVDANVDVKLGPGHFIGSFVIGNMLASHLDHVIMNRMMAIYNGKPMEKTASNLPFLVADYTKDIDKVLTFTIERFKQRAMRFEEMFSSISTVYAKNGLDLLKLPEGFYTRSVEWIYLIARLPHLEFFLSVSAEDSHSKNRDHINVIRKYLKVLRGANLFGTAMNTLDTRAVMADITYGIKDKL